MQEFERRDARRVSDPGAAARQPDTRAILPAIHLSTLLVLRDEGHQGAEHVRHGAGRLARPTAVGAGGCFAKIGSSQTGHSPVMFRYSAKLPSQASEPATGRNPGATTRRGIGS